MIFYNDYGGILQSLLTTFSVPIFLFHPIFFKYKVNYQNVNSKFGCNFTFVLSEFFHGTVIELHCIQSGYLGGPNLFPWLNHGANTAISKSIFNAI